MKYMCLPLPKAHHIFRLIDRLAATCLGVHGIQCMYLAVSIEELGNWLNKGAPNRLHI